MTLPRFALAAALIVLIGTVTAAAQQSEPAPGNDTAQASIAAPRTAQPDTSTTRISTVFGDTAATGPQRKWPKPTPTLIKSMVFPGWGQFTNHKYAKAAIAFGLETFYISQLVYHWHKSDQYLAEFRADPANVDAYYDYDFHRSARNDYMWWLGITMFVSMFDAYVDAHLRPYEHDDIPGVAPPKGIAIVIKSF